MPAAWRSLLWFAVPWTLAAAAVFLLASDIGGAWQGHVVSYRPSAEQEPRTLAVLVVDEHGSSLQRWWPAPFVQRLGVPSDATGLPPPRIPEGLPVTSKRRGALHAIVEVGDTHEVLPTTSPQALGVACLVWLLGIALRNMMTSGAPWSLERRTLRLPPGQGPSGVPHRPRRGAAASKKGPPPKSRSRRKGRR